MRYARRSLVAAAAVGAVLAPPLGAQTVPLPELRAETPATPEPTPSPASSIEARRAPVEPGGSLERRRASRWLFALGAGLGWDDNIDFQAADGPSDVMLIPRAGIGRLFRHRHGELRAAASGLWTGYRDQKDLRRYYGDFGLEGSWEPSARTRLHGSANIGIGDSASARILREQGVSLPRVKTRTLAAEVGLSRSLGARSTLRLDGRVLGTEFDSPYLVDEGSARASVGLQRDIGGRSAVEIAYGAEHVVSRGTDGSYLTHFGSMQVTRLVSRGTALLVEAGASSTPDTRRAGLDNGENFFGGATFTRKVRRSDVRVFVRHEVAPAFGTGDSRLDLRAGLSAAIPMGRSWELAIVTSHVEPVGPSSAGYGSSYDGFASLGRRVGRWFDLSAEARYRRTGPGSETPATQAFQAGVFVSLLTTPARGSGLLR